jgi:uncharacterized protein (DUF1778 family)
MTMEKSARFEMRISPEAKQLLADTAQQRELTRSELLRKLIREEAAQLGLLSGQWSMEARTDTQEG